MTEQQHETASVSDELLRAVANPYRCKDKFIMPGDALTIDNAVSIDDSFFAQPDPAAATDHDAQQNMDDVMMSILGGHTPRDGRHSSRRSSSARDEPRPLSFRMPSGNAGWGDDDAACGVTQSRMEEEEQRANTERRREREREREREMAREMEKERERQVTHDLEAQELERARESERQRDRDVERMSTRRERNRDREERRERRDHDRCSDRGERHERRHHGHKAGRSPPSSGGMRTYNPPAHVKPDQALFGDDMAEFRNDFNDFNVSNQRETEALEKAELLAKMNQLEREGFPPIKRMTVNTALDDIRYELYRMTREANRSRNLKSMRNYLVTAASLVEMANDAVNPFELNLSGFSNSIMNSMEEYDQTLLALHHKYSGRGSGMAPEWKLAMSLTFAAIVHHTSGMASQPARSRGRSSDGVRRMAGGGGGGGGMAGMFSGLNPFGMLFNMMRGGSGGSGGGGAASGRGPSTVPKRNMQGPPSDSSESD